MKPEWQIAWLQSPKEPRIYRSYGAQICAPSCPSRVGKGCLRSLFWGFKTLVSFPEAVAFAWLDQADLGLSRRPRPSPLDGSSLLTQPAAPEAQRRGAWHRVSAESTFSPGGAGQTSAARIKRRKCMKKRFAALFIWTSFLYLNKKTNRHVNNLYIKHTNVLWMRDTIIFIY